MSGDGDGEGVPDPPPTDEPPAVPAGGTAAVAIERQSLRSSTIKRAGK